MASVESLVSVGMAIRRAESSGFRWSNSPKLGLGLEREGVLASKESQIVRDGDE
jgi:hypothetical protein